MISRDHRARIQAQRELERPLVIEAGAGTGKTATLVARILAWSLGPGWTKAAGRLGRRVGAPASEPGRGEDDRIAAATLRGVVAITFTEAAAAEMAERVTAALAEVERGERPVGFTALDVSPASRLDPAVLRCRAGALLSAGDQLQVRTIHSFCRKLLAQHPFEAALHPHFTVDADGTALREIVEEVVETALLRGYGDPGDADYLALAGHGQGPMEVAEAVFQLASAGWTPRALDPDPLAPERRGELLERLWQVTNRLQTLLETRRVSGTRARNASLLLDGLGRLRRHLRRARRCDSVEVSDLKSWLDDGLPQNLTDHLRLWARGATANQAEKERLASARRQLVPLADELHRTRTHVGRLDPELLACSRRVLGPLLGQVQDEMRRRGILGFADLLREADHLAASRPELLAELRRRIDQLLVDEFQDTDARQCALIRRLALEGPYDERPGLFVVGDPKQSIYGWRNADLAAYEEFVAALTEAGGEVLPLDENFRSVPAILDEVERLVAPVMQRLPGLQPQFRPLTASLPAAAEEAWLPVEHWTSWLPDPETPGLPAEGTARETHELEARALAADLLDLHGRGVAWKDVGILFRSLTDVETYLAALREARIPFLVSRDRQYYRRREIIDAAALVRAVLAPEDTLALLTFLRSVVVGVPDAALLPLWSAELPRLLAELRRPDADRVSEVRAVAARVAGNLPAEVPGIERVRGWEHNLAYAAQCLAELRQAFDTEPVDVFVDRLRRSTLFEASESARHLGAFRQANLDRFFHELIVALEQDSGDDGASGHRHRVLRRLRTRIAAGFDAEEARPGEAAEDAVQVLTIHKAKGLEFRHVYLLQMHKEAGGRSTTSLEVGEVDGHTEYRFFGAATLGFDRLTARRDAVARAELVRTLYVAATRAAERLVLVGRRPMSGFGTPLDRAATHMDLVLHRRGDAPSVTDLAEMWSDGAARVQAGDVGWCLPGRLAGATDAPQDTTDDAVVLPSVEVARAIRDRLRQARTDAARRMQRPFRQVASKIGAERTDDAAEPRSIAYVPESATPASESERRSAMAAGSAVHRVLETFDFAAHPEEDLERRREQLGELVKFYATGDESAAALSRAESLLDRFAQGQLFRRFLEIGGWIVARELPVLLPPADGDDAVGYLAGVVDLVYREPETGELVIADYKTDRVTSPDAAMRHSERYAAQGNVYVRAVGEMLELAERPRFELWYLDADHLQAVTLAPPVSSGAGQSLRDEDAGSARAEPARCRRSQRASMRDEEDAARQSRQDACGPSTPRDLPGKPGL